MSGNFEGIKTQKFGVEVECTGLTRADAAKAISKVLQMANGAIYGDNKAFIPIHDKKLDALEDLIEAANGKPVLVAYWFKHDFDRISERLHKLHTPFSSLDSDNSIRRWNRGELPAALIHPASAGHGLNLQSGGSTLIWFGLTWSLELYGQTNKTGKKKGDKDCLALKEMMLTAKKLGINKYGMDENEHFGDGTLNAVRKLIECVKVLSKTEIMVIFKGGYEVKTDIE